MRKAEREKGYAGEGERGPGGGVVEVVDVGVERREEMKEEEEGEEGEGRDEGERRKVMQQAEMS